MSLVSAIQNAVAVELPKDVVQLIAIYHVDEETYKKLLEAKGDLLQPAISFYRAALNDILHYRRTSPIIATVAQFRDVDSLEFEPEYLQDNPPEESNAVVTSQIMPKVQSLAKDQGLPSHALDSFSQLAKPVIIGLMSQSKLFEKDVDFATTLRLIQGVLNAQLGIQEVEYYDYSSEKQQPQVEEVN